MSTRTRNKTYGKKKGIDLTAAFESLNLSPTVEQALTEPVKDNVKRPLQEVSHNATSRKTQRDRGSAVQECEPDPKVNTPLELATRAKPNTPTDSAPQPQQPKTRGRKPKRMPQAQLSPASQTMPSPEQPLPNTLPQQPKRRGRKPKHAPNQCHASTSQATPEPVKSTPNPLPLPNISLTHLQPLLSLPFIRSTLHPFTPTFDEWSQTFTITKVSQGSYASILRLALKSDPDIYTLWKLMPLRPNTGKGSRLEGATSLSDAMAEVKLLEGISRTPGFVEFRSAQVLQGGMPEGLKAVEAEWWRALSEEERRRNLTDVWLEHEEGEANSYDEGQVWLFIEMTDAGCDLEKWLEQRRRERDWRGDEGRPTIFEVWDLFWGVVEALAHGESHAEFEHRDLHPGNVCVKRRRKEVRDGEEGTAAIVGTFTDLEVTLIDYTLSRARIRTPSHSAEAEETALNETEILANSMKEKSIFEQNSAKEIDQMQYDNYRHMRDVMHHNHKGVQRKNGWKSYMPMTNILWLHHILTILLKETRMFNEEWGCIGWNRVMDSKQGLTTFHLDDIRQAIHPGKMWEWEHQSATDLLAWEMHSGLDARVWTW